MRDEQRCPVTHHGFQVVEDLLFCLGVDARSGIVEDENPRVRQQGTRDRDPLLLSAREIDPLFAEHRLVAVGERIDLRGDLRDLGRFGDLPIL